MPFQQAKHMYTSPAKPDLINFCSSSGPKPISIRWCVPACWNLYIFIYDGVFVRSMHFIWFLRYLFVCTPPLYNIEIWVSDYPTMSMRIDMNYIDFTWKQQQMWQCRLRSLFPSVSHENCRRLLQITRNLILKHFLCVPQMGSKK